MTDFLFINFINNIELYLNYVYNIFGNINFLVLRNPFDILCLKFFKLRFSVKI